MKNLFLLSIFFISISISAQKPKVWVISDGGYKINDPDDISAVASYILMSNMFDTRAIVMGSTIHPWHKKSIDQKKWAEDTYGVAYAKDLPNLNKYIGGYQKDFRFLESSVKGMGVFSPQKNYSLSDYPSILALFNEVNKSKDIINVLCYGPLTEQAILVSYCLKNNRTDILNKIRFISHWTNSNFHVGTLKNPEHTHNCWADGIACEYIKNKAANGNIVFYECGGIGQYGLVEGGPKGAKYYNLFKDSNLGKIFAEGKFTKDRVDDSDAATYWVLLGNYGVSLNDIASNGLNFPEVEKRNEEAFALHSKDMRNELLRRSNAAAGRNPDAIKIDVIVPEHGMADPHAWVQNDTLFFIAGHDESWAGKGSFRMDRWEVWSSVDLKTYTHHRNIYPKQTYIGDQPNCWAGDICERNGKYYWFFSNRNLNTGVMVADKITGEYKDLLGKPLLPEGIVPVHPYDPEIFIENGVYTICFGSGTYYMATLSEDMKSLASEPKQISVLDKNGKELSTDDKSTLFKRNGWYYLVYGSKYAMSKNLYGPYNFKGAFLNGGHTSFFEWHGQWYVLQENHDISAFYRGASLKPIFFNEDDTIFIPQDDRMYPGPGRTWEFELSTMGWQAVNGTTIYFNNGKLSGNISDRNAMVKSAPWLYTDLTNCSKLTIKMKNNSWATRMQMAIFSRDEEPGFWRIDMDHIDWSKEDWINIPISSNDSDFVTYTIDLSQFKNTKKRLMQIALKPIYDTFNGTWEIDEIKIE